MEALIKVDDPDRWARWLLRRGQEEEAEEGQSPPLGDAGAPSGSVDPMAAANMISDSEHHEYQALSGKDVVESSE